MSTQVWAHRGASGHAPENTLEAFRMAVDMNADGIELDVHMSRDGELVVIHDEKVDRTSNGKGYIKDLTFAELRELDFSCGMEKYRGAKIPTLREVYELMKPTGLYINVEIKCDIVIYWGMWDKLYALEREMGMQGRILYSSFNHYVLLEMRKLDPDAKIGLLYSCAIVDPWVYAKYLNANALHPHYLILRAPGMIENCRKAGVDINTFTVNDPEAMKELIEKDVHAIITNYPDAAVKIREEMKR
jgi:glycerophosphoryl diester phosphodiesterase